MKNYKGFTFNFLMQYVHGKYTTNKKGIFWFSKSRVIKFMLGFGILYIKLW